MSLRRAGVLAAWLALSSCAGDDAVETQFDSSAGMVTVELLGDGFVRVDDRRVPLEAFVLELRQSMRQMARADLLRYVVRVRLAAVGGGAAARTQRASRRRLLGELEIMGVRQIVYL